MSRFQKVSPPSAALVDLKTNHLHIDALTGLILPRDLGLSAFCVKNKLRSFFWVNREALPQFALINSLPISSCDIRDGQKPCIVDSKSFVVDHRSRHGERKAQHELINVAQTKRPLLFEAYYLSKRQTNISRRPFLFSTQAKLHAHRSLRGFQSNLWITKAHAQRLAEHGDGIRHGACGIDVNYERFENERALSNSLRWYNAEETHIEAIMQRIFNDGFHLNFHRTAEFPLEMQGALQRIAETNGYASTIWIDIRDILNIEAYGCTLRSDAVPHCVHLSIGQKHLLFNATQTSDPLRICKEFWNRQKICKLNMHPKTHKGFPYELSRCMLALREKRRLESHFWISAAEMAFFGIRKYPGQRGVSWPPSQVGADEYYNFDQLQNPYVVLQSKRRESIFEEG